MIKPPTTVNMQFSSLTSVSPSFTGDSSNNLADIAARVVEEFRNENRHNDDDDYIYTFDHDVNQVYDTLDHQPEDNCTEELTESEEESEEDEEFEFAVSGNEIFYNGEISPRYPLFDRSLLLDDDEIDKSDGDLKNSKRDRTSPVVVRRPLMKLFIEERESASYSSSSSSSESGDLDGVSPATNCIWKPKVEVESRESCKKGNSTGNSSKRWRFRNLLHRCNSDVNMTAGEKAPVIVFRRLTKKRSEKVKKFEKTAKVAGADDDGEPPVTEQIDAANKLNKEGDRVRSYLPYKRDLVGVFANVNGLSRNLHPF